MTRIRPTSAISILALAAAVSATGAELRGTLREAKSERALSGVRVDIGEGLLVVGTREGGEFRADVPPGRHRVRVEERGYELLDTSVAVPPQGLRLDLSLRPSPLFLHETVVVSALHAPRGSFESPRAVAVVSADDMARQASRTTPEALFEVAGVWVQKTNHGGGSPFLRGLAGNQVLVLVDGVRLNNGTFRYGPNQYLATLDPFSLERIEVVRGIGSVQHGSDALGGVVSVFAAQPEFSAGDLAVSGRVYGKVASSGQETSGRAELQVAARNAAVRGGFSLRDYGDLRGGRGTGTLAPSGYGEQDGDVKAAFRMGQGHLLTAGYQHVHQSDVPRWDQVVQRGFARYSFDPQVRQLGYVQLHSSFSSPWISSLKVVGSFHRSDETRKRQRAGSPVIITERDTVDTWGGSLLGRSNVRGAVVSWGAESYRDAVESSRRDADGATGTVRSVRGLYPDGATARSAAAFADVQWRSGRWLAEAGARYTQHRVSATDGAFGHLDVSPRALVGSAGASFEWRPGQRLVASVDQGFRAPNIDDLSTLGLFDFGIEVPSPTLEPERALSYEVGWKMRTARVAAAASVFRSNLRDLIDRVPDVHQGAAYLEGQRVYRRKNVGRAHIQGAEADVQWRATPGLVALVHLTYTLGEMDSSGEPVRRIPPLNGGVALRWSAHRRLSWDGSVRFAARQDRLGAGDRADHRIAPGGTPGFSVVSTRAAFSPHARLTLYAGVENMFDEAYRVHGSGIDGQGRTAWLASQVRF